MKQTIEPKAMMGILPTWSVSLPENGLLNPAVKVNSAMMYPIYSLPPRLAK